MKKMGKTLLALTMALALALLTACGGGFDASGYVGSFMDMVSKGEVTEYAKLTGQSEEEAGEQYQELLEGLREAFDGEGVTDETRDKLVDVYVQILQKAKYTVHEAEKTEKGYDVTVDIEPVTGVYEGLMDEVSGEMNAAIDAGELTQDNMYDWIYSHMADKMAQRLESLSYGPVQSVTVHLVKEDKTYVIEDQEEVSERIGQLLIDQSSMTEQMGDE